MPADVMTVIIFLCLGYALFLVELVVPGGILGILGVVSVLYGCYLAFGLGFMWGAASIVASVLFFVLSIRWLLKSKTGRRLTMSDADQIQSSKSIRDDWQRLVGQVGEAMTPLRPAGLAEIDGERVDVVSDNEFLDSGTALRVVEVEGRRIVVEAIREAVTEASRETVVDDDEALADTPGPVAESAAPAPVAESAAPAPVAESVTPTVSSEENSPAT